MPISSRRCGFVRRLSSIAAGFLYHGFGANEPGSQLSQGHRDFRDIDAGPLAHE
jgi:hypothetical protein